MVHFDRELNTKLCSVNMYRFREKMNKNKQNSVTPNSVNIRIDNVEDTFFLYNITKYFY